MHDQVSRLDIFEHDDVEIATGREKLIDLMRETYFASACIQNRAHRLLSDLKRHMASDLLLVSVFTDNSAWSCFGASTVPVQDAASIYRVFS
jgi:hypothetical protein